MTPIPAPDHLARLRALSARYDAQLDALKLAARRGDAKEMDAASLEADAIAHDLVLAVEEFLLSEVAHERIES